MADASLSIPLRLVSTSPWPWTAIETAVLRVDSGIPKALAAPPPDIPVRTVRARSDGAVVREKQREMAGSSNSTAAFMVAFPISVQSVEDAASEDPSKSTSTGSRYPMPDALYEFCSGQICTIIYF